MTPSDGAGKPHFAHQTLHYASGHLDAFAMEPLGYLPPVEHEMNYYREQKPSPARARLN